MDITQEDIERLTVNNHLWNITGNIWGTDGKPMSQEQIHYWYECLDWWEKEYTKKAILEKYADKE